MVDDTGKMNHAKRNESLRFEKKLRETYVVLNQENC